MQSPSGRELGCTLIRRGWVKVDGCARDEHCRPREDRRSAGTRSRRTAAGREDDLRRAPGRRALRAQDERSGRSAFVGALLLSRRRKDGRIRIAELAHGGAGTRRPWSGDTRRGRHGLGGGSICQSLSSSGSVVCSGSSPWCRKSANSRNMPARSLCSSMKTSNPSQNCL